jgi:hypothetical protein
MKQLTIEQWLSRPKEGKSNKQAKPFEKYEKAICIEIPKTISCIELEMKHDKYGNVIDWINGEPKTRSWDGSIDNQEKALELHVGKYGWRF